MKKHNILFINAIIFILMLSIAQFTYAQKGLTTTTEDAIFEKIEKEYTLNNDGSSTYNYSKRLKINTFNAMNRYYGETFILYNPQYQTLKINKCQTILPNGNIVVNTDNAFNEVLPRFCAKAPAYNYLKEMVVTHIGLELGAIIELDYTITTKPGFTTFYSDEIIFGEAEPILEYNVVLNVPEGTKLGHGMNISICDEPVKQTENGFDTYKWNAKNLAPIPTGRAIANISETTPILVFTTARDFQRVFFDLAKQKCYENLTAPSAKEVIREIQSKNNLELVQMVEIQKYVINNILLVDIPDNLLGNKFADAETIWQRKYATKAEKAILMAAMMHDAGISAMPGYVCETTLYDVKVACPNIFNNWIVKVISDKQPIYISVTEQNKNNLKYYDLSKNIVWGINATAETLRSDIFEIQQPTVQLNCSLRFDNPEKLVGNAVVRTENEFQPYLLALVDENATKKLINNIPEKAITQIKNKIMTESKGDYQIQVDQKDFLQQKGDYFIWNLPSIKSVDQYFNYGTLPIKRDAALVAHPLRYNVHVNLTIPDDFELVTPLVAKYSRKSFGNYTIEIKLNENVVTIDKVLEITETEANILPIHYDVFRAFYNEWNHDLFKQLIFKKK
ncbi:MAG: DUF3857 domain-containing protein [Bacilli bacterium]|nr:DUF3857 domain-containing protein [Bacilli bacterium]